ncbi:MAG: magnesium/cobalt transporter CorA [Cyclonatronaceae bacterium]
MPRFIKKYKEKVGLPPGTLIHLGSERTTESRIILFDYDEKEIHEKEISRAEECFPFRDTATVTWINVDGVHQTGVIEELGNHFGIHPLVLSDIVNTQQRPKIEDYDDYLFVVLKMIYQGNHIHKADTDTNGNQPGNVSQNNPARPGNGEITAEQVSLIIGPNYVISFQETSEDLFNPIRNRLRSSSGRIRKKGADYLAYTLIDTIVDNYFVILETLGEKVEDLEDELLKFPGESTMLAIHNLKRDMIFLRRSVWPLREVTGFLERGESKLIHKTTRVYLRDVYDHTIQVVDNIETARDILSGMLDIYLSTLSNRTNSVMKVLTIIATIFMPLTFIAGVYGMNFVNMPELQWHWGYPLIMLIMFMIAMSMLTFFKKKKWI